MWDTDSLAKQSLINTLNDLVMHIDILLQFTDSFLECCHLFRSVKFCVMHFFSQQYTAQVRGGSEEETQYWIVWFWSQICIFLLYKEVWDVDWSPLKVWSNVRINLKALYYIDTPTLPSTCLSQNQLSMCVWQHVCLSASVHTQL